MWPKVRQCVKAMLRAPYDTIPAVQFSLERAGMFLDMKRGKYRQALIHARNEAAYAPCFADTTAFLASVYQDIALMNARLQRYDSALWYYDKALEANLTERRIPALKRIYRQEAEIYKRLGRHQAYYDKIEAFMELSRYSDSLARAERHENLDYVILQRAQARKMMQIQYEVLYKDQIIKKQRLLATGSALLFLLVSALLFLLYQSKRKKERTNRLLYEKTKQLLDLSQAQTERWKALATGLDLPTEDVSMPLEDSMSLDENSGHGTLPVSGESEIPEEADSAKEAKGTLSGQAASCSSQSQESLKVTYEHPKAPHSETAGLHPETPHSGQVSYPDRVSYIEQDSRLDQTRIRQLIAGILQLLEKEECWLQPDFTIEKAAKQLGTNSSYLSYVVNHHLGKSFSTLLNEYRVRRACLLMENPPMQPTRWIIWPCRPVSATVSPCSGSSSAWSAWHRPNTGKWPAIPSRSSTNPPCEKKKRAFRNPFWVSETPSWQGRYQHSFYYPRNYAGSSPFFSGKLLFFLHQASPIQCSRLKTPLPAKAISRLGTMPVCTTK